MSCWYWYEFWFFGQLGNMKHRCLARGNHFVNVSNVLVQSNVKIVLKGIYFSISQTAFSIKSFYVFFFLKTCPNPFVVVTNTFILFYRLFWTVSILHGWKSFLITLIMKGAVIQIVFSYWLLEYFLSTHFSNCRGQAFVIQTTLVSCISLTSTFWNDLCDFWIELLYQGLFHYQ